MNRQRIYWTGFLRPGVLMLIGMLMTGCGGNPADRLRERLAQRGDAGLDNALRRSISATGGIDAWAHLKRIDGKVIATLAGADGSNTLVEQQHIIVPGERVMMSISSREPDGILLEWLDQKGKVQTLFQGRLDQSSISPEKIDLYGAALRLRLLSQAMTGAAGLLQKDFTLRYAGQERKGGRLTHKIEVVGPLLGRDQFDYGQTGNLLAVWIDAETYLFERLWLRYHRDKNEFGYLAVNIAEYAQTSAGLVLPRLIEFVRSDEHQQFGDLYIMTVDYQDLQITGGAN